MIKQIAHTAYTCKDMEAAKKFYEELLGFKYAFTMNYPGTDKPWIVYMHVAGEQFVELFYDGVVPNPEFHEGNIGYSHLCVEVEDIYAIEAKIKELGYPLDVEAKFGIDGNWQCWTHDPDGNRIELMQMGDDCLQKKYLRGE